MAVVLQTGDWLAVRYCCWFDGQASNNCQWYKVGTTVVGGPTDVWLAQYISTTIAPKYKSFIHSQAQYAGVLLQAYRDIQVFPQVISSAGAGPGNPATIPQAKVVCGLTTKRTALAQPAFRGRIYWPFPYADVANTSSLPNQAQIDAMDSLALSILSPWNITDGVTQLSAAPFLRHTKPEVPDTEITGWLTRQKWASQHRRGDYGRPNEPNPPIAGLAEQ